MAVSETIILTAPVDIKRRVTEMQLDVTKCLRVRDTAAAAAADATPFHAANAAGTFSYHYGTFALRLEFVGKSWRQARPNGVEVIENEELRIRVVFANVDVACNLNHRPKARSERGAGAERLAQGNLFDALPTYGDSDATDKDGWIVYFLMVDEKGAVELTRAGISGGTFTKPVERIFLSDGTDLATEPDVKPNDQSTVEFDPQVTRKKTA